MLYSTRACYFLARDFEVHIDLCDKDTVHFSSAFAAGLSMDLFGTLWFAYYVQKVRKYN